MKGIGMGAFGAFRRRQKPTKKCKLCGLRYTVDKEECPHCSGLSDSEVKRLKSRFTLEQIANSRLGIKMLLAAIVLFMFLILLTAM
ncbi:MAG: hypothetical protein DBP02_21705 [gamma proteobacterium symbiont of Ctena orbiculata]|nr:MAG: hypothetical protein DBP01_19915 [gamma proteobacterium symbiont of Ctena orbiculata]PUB79840.1 MAG: hypothetical protein DBP02_21705 [gamma proteobacterium symbiont of Ctena orbiculata]